MATTDATITNLLAWTVAGGAHWSPSIEVRDDGARGRGVFVNAGADIPEGTLLLKLPAALAVTPEQGKIAGMVATGTCSGLVGLILTLVRELYVVAPRQPFPECLATTALPGVACLWSAAVRTQAIPTTS